MSNRSSPNSSNWSSNNWHIPIRFAPYHERITSPYELLHFRPRSDPPPSRLQKIHRPRKRKPRRHRKSPGQKRKCHPPCQPPNRTRPASNQPAPRKNPSQTSGKHDLRRRPPRHDRPPGCPLQQRTQPPLHLLQTPYRTSPGSKKKKNSSTTKTR